MAAVVDCDCAQRVLLGPVDSPLHDLAGENNAKALVGVDHHRRRSFAHDLVVAHRLDVAALQLLDVAGQTDDAVGIVSGQVRIDQMIDGDPALIGRQAGGREDGCAEVAQRCVLNGGHGSVSFAWGSLPSDFQAVKLWSLSPDPEPKDADFGLWGAIICLYLVIVSTLNVEPVLRSTLYKNVQIESRLSEEKD